MKLADIIRRMIAAGATPEAIAMAIEALQASQKSSRQARNRRYYEAHRKPAIKTIKTSETSEKVKTIKTSETSETTELRRPLARVDDNLLPLETSGRFQEKGVSQGSNEPFETLVPEGKKPLRKDRVVLFQTVVGMWNDMAAGANLVAVRDITPTRQAAIVARSEDLVKTYEFPDPLAGWRKLMGLVRGSPFLRGELNGFRCDFDFATRASSFTKIMEGKYEARQASGRRR
jgi:hypothetical protein